LGKVIDVEFRSHGRGRWCTRCDEPFPDGTAMCPRCGGPLDSAAHHRARMEVASRRTAQRWAASAIGFALLLLALAVWLVMR
jgi:predicted amidophosphoribosyltransferase